MLDLETMGTSPTAAIVAIGAVAFEPMTGELGASFYRTIDLSSSIALGGRVDGETVGWWLRQSDEARQAVMADPSELTSALMEFSAWCEVIAPKEDLLVWGNGASFDNVILSSAYESINMPRPWGKFRDRCYRTMKAVRRDIEIARVGTHHNALDDAKSQALHLSKIMMALQAPAQAGEARPGDAVAARLARMWLCTHYADGFEASDIEALCWSILGCKDRATALFENARMPMGQAIELACSEAAPAPVAQRVSQCSLKCTTECIARVHGCASECPALPWQPAASAPVVHPEHGGDMRQCRDCADFGPTCPWDGTPCASASAPVAQPARWYMVNKIGMATLCTDEYDARIEAANANEQYPLYRPHRAVQLVEVPAPAPVLTPAQALTDAQLDRAVAAWFEGVAPPHDAGPKFRSRMRAAIEATGQEGGAA